jgi:hypothetical protein
MAAFDRQQGKQMAKLRFTVRADDLSKLPSGLGDLCREQKAEGASCLFVTEGGLLLNEADKQVVSPIFGGAKPSEVLARAGEALEWMFSRLEGELEHDFSCNYMKMSFVNLTPIATGQQCDSSTMSTIFPELSDEFRPSPDLILLNLVTSLRCFFSHLRAAVERDGWDSEGDACDWVSLTITKSQE